MKSLKSLFLIIFCLTFGAIVKAQLPSEPYLLLNGPERLEFVSAKLDEITVKISGNTYNFDENFKIAVKKSLDAYASRRESKVNKGRFGDGIEFVLKRGSEVAPIINQQFDKNGISRLSGLYIAMIETEFNANLISPTGTKGIFQIDAVRAKKYGLATRDFYNVEKTADVTARYLSDSQKTFTADKMKEFLAILSWNRDAKKIKFDISFKFMSESKYVACSICGLTQYPNRFDKQFQTESVKYVPKFLAAAIIGENPKAFGLSNKPLSAY